MGDLRSRTLTFGLALAVPLATGACSMSSTQRGAVIGAAGGAAAGAAVGAATGSTARGAIIGAAVGGTAGAIIGSRMDRQAEELADEIPNATIERVGEGLLVTFDSGLLFEYNSDVIEGNARENLNNLAESLREYRETELLIVGHTDSIASDRFNQDLSERRAASAKRYLASQGVDADRIETVGRGESEPVADNGTPEGRGQNRRVEVAIFASEEYRERVARSSGR